jgi:hypothetical protein
MWLLSSYIGGNTDANRVQLDANRTAGTIVNRHRWCGRSAARRSPSAHRGDRAQAEGPGTGAIRCQPDAMFASDACCSGSARCYEV